MRRPRRSFLAQACLMLTLVCLITPSLTGCARMNRHPVARTVRPPVAVSNVLPAIVTETPVLYDVSPLVDLPRQTPFVSLVAPETMGVLEDKMSSAEMAVPEAAYTPPVNPFSNISLEGLILSKKNPMAMLKLGGKSMVVKVGQSFSNTDGGVSSDIVVQKIDTRSIQLYASNGDMRTLTVSSMFGMGKLNALRRAENLAKAAPASEETEATPPAEAPPVIPTASKTPVAQKPPAVKDLESLPGELKSIFKSYLKQQQQLPEKPSETGLADPNAGSGPNMEIVMQGKAPKRGGSVQ